MRRLASLLCVVAVAALSASLAQAQAQAPGQAKAQATGQAPAPAQTLTVAVDSALAPALAALARSFEAARPGVAVRLLPGAAGALLEQIAAGTAADVLAGTDAETANSGLQRHLLLPDLRAAFASNTLVLIVPARSILAVGRLADLARPEVLRIAIGRQASVPSARAAREVINSQRLWPSLQRKLVQADDEQAVLALVATADVEAGLVFGSTAAAAIAAPVADRATASESVAASVTAPATASASASATASASALAASKVRQVETLATALPVRHLAHVTAGSRHGELAAAFVAHLRSDSARAELQRLGFGMP